MSAVGAHVRVPLPILGQPAAGESVCLSPEEHCRAAAAPDEGFRHLPIELFSTERGCFVFDARNVCFLEVEPVARDLLAILRDRQATIEELIAELRQHAEAEVRRAYQDLLDIQAEGLLLPYRFERRPRFENAEYEQVLSRRMGGFTVFITTRCNLACSYCIYGGQYEQHEQLTEEAMPWETVKATMDFLAAHSMESQEVRLNFFGGEPLLAFRMIDRGVRYLKSILPASTPRVLVTITSNGTVISDAIMDFLLEHDVYLQFSIDGDRAAHDQARLFKGVGRGSFDVILRNLQRIHERAPDYYRGRIRLKGVLTTDGVESADREFFEHPLIKVIVDEGHFAFVVLEPHYDLAKDDDYFQRIHKLGGRLLGLRGIRSATDLLGTLNVKQRALYEQTLGRFFEVQAVNRVYFDGMDALPFTKGCMTGYQEGAVKPNGEISICLKSAKGENFVIGNVREGRWYFEKMRELNTLFHRGWAGCSSCFVQKMCDLCYEKLDGQVGEWAAGRSRFCEFNRERHRVIFNYMLRVVENNPALWEDLERVVESRLAERSEGEENLPQRYARRSLYKQDG